MNVNPNTMRNCFLQKVNFIVSKVAKRSATIARVARLHCKAETLSDCSQPSINRSVFVFFTAIPDDVMAYVAQFTGIECIVAQLSAASQECYQRFQSQYLWRLLSSTVHNHLNGSAYQGDFRSLYRDRNGWFPLHKTPDDIVSNKIIPKETSSTVQVCREPYTLHSAGGSRGEPCNAAESLTRCDPEPRAPYPESRRCTWKRCKPHFQIFSWSTKPEYITDIYLCRSSLLTATGCSTSVQSSATSYQTSMDKGPHTAANASVPLQLKLSYNHQHPSYRVCCATPYHNDFNTLPHRTCDPPLVSPRSDPTKPLAHDVKQNHSYISIQNINSLKLTQRFLFNTSRVNCLDGTETSTSTSNQVVIAGDQDGQLFFLRDSGKGNGIDATFEDPLLLNSLHRNNFTDSHSRDSLSDVKLTSQMSILAVRTRLGSPSAVELFDLNANGQSQGLLKQHDFSGYALESLALGKARTINEIYAVGKTPCGLSALVCIDFRTREKIQHQFTLVPYLLGPIRLTDNDVFVNCTDSSWDAPRSLILRFDRRWTSTSSEGFRPSHLRFYPSSQLQMGDFCCLHNQLYTYGLQKNQTLGVQRWLCGGMEPRVEELARLPGLPHTATNTVKRLSHFPRRPVFRCDDRGWFATYDSLMFHGRIAMPRDEVDDFFSTDAIQML